MIEYVKVKVETEIDELIAITCNSCGTRHESKGRFDTGLHDFHDFQIEGGYESTYPCDLERVSFSVCGGCLKKIVSEFKIPVESFDMLAQ